MTPWGEVQEVCSRLPPGPGKDRDMVFRNQRERMFAAMVVVSARKGYATARVADVIAVAGVSRNTFYAQFDNLRDCFVATVEAVLEGAEAVMRDALARDAPWDERLRGCYGALLELVVAQPAAARMCLVESYVAGPAAVGRVDALARRVGREVLGVLEQSPERAGVPSDVARAVLGGLRMVVQTRLHAGRERELLDLAPVLLDWALSYRTPPAELRGPEPAATAPPTPEPAAVVPAASEPDARDPDRRIRAVLVEVAARKGYRTTTVSEIASATSISLTTFYKCYESKDAAFLAALDEVMETLFELTTPAYRNAEDWAQGTRAAVEVVFTFMADNPTVAQFATEAVWSGGPEAIARIEHNMAGFRAMLAEGLRHSSAPRPAVAEAIGASILALGYDTVARGEVVRLRQLTAPAAFVALAPVVGSIEACTVANGG